MPHRLANAAVARFETRAATGSLIVAVLLMATKFLAYYLTGSAAVFSDAIESIVNVLAGSVSLYAIILAHRPADESHPYGHGKVEFFSSGFEGGMILLAAVFIAWRAVESLVYGAQIQKIDTGLVLLAATMVINGGTGLFLIRVGKKHGSITLEADGKHVLSDAVTSVAVIAALLIVKATAWSVADPICAMLVAAYLIWVSVDLLKRSAAGLMDEQDTDDARLLEQILDSHLVPAGKPPLICSYHKLRHRHTGRYHWIDFHVVVPADLNVAAGHEIASEIEGEIERALGVGDATAHVEPCVSRDCVRCNTPVETGKEVTPPIPAVVK